MIVCGLLKYAGTLGVMGLVRAVNAFFISIDSSSRAPSKLGWSDHSYNVI